MKEWNKRQIWHWQSTNRATAAQTPLVIYFECPRMTHGANAANVTKHNVSCCGGSEESVK